MCSPRVMGNFHKGLSFLGSFQFALYRLQNRAFLYHPQNWASTDSQQDRGREEGEHAPSSLRTFPRGPLATVLSFHWIEFSHMTKTPVLIDSGSLYVFSGLCILDT